VPDARYLPDGSRQKYCLYILDGETDQLSDFSIISKLIWALYSDQVYSTVRKAKVPRNSRNWQDNRAEYCFSMKSREATDLLKLPRIRFRQDVFSWIKATAKSDSSESIDQARVLGTWYVSNGAVSALHSLADANLSTIYTGSR
jgi:hypothetical protein